MSTADSVTNRTRPGKGGFILTGILVLISGLLVIGGIAVVFYFIFNLVEAMPQTVVPGQSEIELSEPGDYTIFYESPSVVDGRKIVGPSQFPADLTLSVTDLKTGAEIPLSGTGMTTMSYDYGGRSGRSILTFTVPSATTVELSGAYEKGSSGPEVVVTVQQATKFFKEIFQMVIGMFVAIGGGVLVFIGAIVTLVITLVRRGAAST